MLGGVDGSEAVDLGKSQNPQASITRNVAAKNLQRIGQGRNHPLSERESVFLNLGSSRKRVGDFGVFLELWEHAGENFQPQIFLVA